MVWISVVACTWGFWLKYLHSFNVVRPNQSKSSVLDRPSLVSLIGCGPGFGGIGLPFNN